jgi:predicted dehydrogenase
MKRKVRVGIIGAGGIARGAHAPAYAAIPDQAKMVAVAEVEEERSKAFAKEFSIPRVYTDYNQMLEKEDLDLVSVCVPPFLHRDATVAALKAGVHVLCEKPMAMNAKEAKEMIAAAKAAKKTLTIGFQSRFGERAQFLKHLIDRGELGEIYFARALALRRRGIPTWGVFTDKSKNGGGPLIDIGVHILDLTLWFMGHPRPVSVVGAVYTKLATKENLYVATWESRGQWDPSKYSVEDFATGQIRFDNGATINLEASWALNIEKGEMNTILCGTEGGANLTPLKVFKEVAGRGLVDWTPAHPEGKEQQHFKSIAHVVECVRTGSQPLVTAEQALMVQQIVDAIYQSGETGKQVVIR